ncbi:MAG: tRNA pseudouridine(55) synthase TruB, partial [Amylibacter sp.]
MAQKSKKRDVDGWLIIDKPAGITSTGVVNKTKWLFKAKKAGHAGTLDPDATGLLAVAFGEATKTIPYIMDSLKTYDFVVTLGASTTTDDAEGDV